MQPTTTRVLVSIRDLVSRAIAPACTTPESAKAVALLDTSLVHLIGRSPGDTARWFPRLRRLEQLIESGRKLNGEQAAVTALTAADIATWADYEQAECRLLGTLAELAKTVARQLEPDGTDAEARSWLREVVADERERALPPPAESDHDHTAAEPDQAAIEKYFRTKLTGGESLEDFEFGTIPGGFSRSTYTVSAKVPGTPSHSHLVVRLARPHGLMDGVALSMAAEQVVIEYAGKCGVPVAPPRWVENDPDVMGGQFLVTQRMPGQPLGTAVDSGGIHAVSLRQAAKALANLHTGEWSSAEHRDLHASLGVDPGLNLRSAFGQSIERWRGFIAQPGINPSPALQAALEWLSGNFPERDVPPALVHGDVGFHNMLFDGEDLSALLDWELADVGDPARDLVAMRRQIPAAEDWKTFIEAYVDAGGKPVSTEVLSFYEVWLAVLSVMTMMVAAENRFALQSPPRSEYLELGLMFKPHFLQQLQQYTDSVWSPSA